MKISKKNAVREDWAKVKSWNYKLPQIDKYKSVVYAEIVNEHGEVLSKDIERIYYIVDGEGEFYVEGETIKVAKGSVLTIPPNTKYNYRSSNKSVLKIVLFMELWDN